jgi:hypothetical protein
MVFNEKNRESVAELPIKNTAQKPYYQLPVVKVAGVEYGDMPDVQTLRTWNS